MKYLHTLDPDEIRELEDYWKSVAELEAEDRAMEKYYERETNNN